VRVLAVDPLSPSTIYAGGQGIFKSTNAGASWIEVDGGVTGVTYAVAIDPRSLGIVYAGGETGFYKTTNGGVLWSLLRQQTYEGVGTLAIDPTTPSRLHASTLNVGPKPPELPPYDSVLRSTDGGATWYRPTSGTPNGITSLAVDPLNPSTVYATSNFMGVYRSADAGATWELFNTGLPDLNLHNVAIGAGSSSTVYVGTFRQSIYAMTPQRSLRPGARALPFRP
jgi:photosystem II stability/assembly factor-like uncharacterized protein